MRTTYRRWLILLNGSLLLSASMGGCAPADDESVGVEQRRSALESGLISPFAPAYYGDDSSYNGDWSNAHSNLHTGQIVVTGPNSRPPLTWDQTKKNDIAPFETNPNIVTLGYVSNVWGRDHNLLTQDISLWASYATDGIFFDVSQRCSNPAQMGCDPGVSGTATDQDLARDEALLQMVIQTPAFSQNKSWITVAFNWGVPYPYMGDRYVGCLEVAMTSVYPQVGAAFEIGVRETDEVTYMNEGDSWDGNNGDGYDWVYNWYPGAFFHLIYDYQGAHSLQDIAQTVASRNATNFFVTDLPYPSQWNHTPTGTLLSSEGSGFTVSYGSFGGGKIPTDCPAPTLCPPGFPGC